MIDALVIVAHPDDETLWMGGYILENQEWEWHILSLCRSMDADRAPKFKKVCAELGAQCKITDLDDEHLQPLEINEVIQKIKSNIPKQSFDYIFTHGENGEYGHLRHKEIHLAVKKMIETKKIKCKNLCYFSYDIKGNAFNKGTNANVIVPMTNNLKSQKKRLIQEVYGFREGIFESNLCDMTQEAFYFQELA